MLPQDFNANSKLKIKVKAKCRQTLLIGTINCDFTYHLILGKYWKLVRLKIKMNKILVIGLNITGVETILLFYFTY